MRREAVGIVTLIAFLVGVILAFMGAVQLSQFGAAIYVADLVGIGMVREMGAMMTAIIMSGRTGAAFAAKLGTMKVTAGDRRAHDDGNLAAGVSGPATRLGVDSDDAAAVPVRGLGGHLRRLVCRVSRCWISRPAATCGKPFPRLTLANLLGGLFKATFYGALIAIAGCLRGFQCGNSSSAVGDAATQAVVMSIVMVVVACGPFAVLFNVSRNLSGRLPCQRTAPSNRP